MFKERLVKLRTDKGLSQYDLAKALGLSRGQLSNYELGTRQPDNATLIKIANFFDVTTDYLLGRTDEPNDVHQRIEAALADDPDAEELITFWQELKEREDLKLLFKQVRPLSDDSIRRIIRIIQAIELEESQEE